jgi:hypothetical protein
MFNPSKAVISLTLIGLFVFSVPAGAATVAESGVADEVNSCVAEVRERLDYNDATHIRHEIVAIERRTVGYTLKISTSLFGEAEGEVIRAYATTCIVNGNNKPLKFTFSEAS